MMTDQTLYKKIWNLLSEYGIDNSTCHRLADQILEVFQTELESNYQHVYYKICRVLADNGIHTLNRHHIADKMMDLMTDNKTCGNCFFSNTIEVIDPVCASMSAVHKFKEDTGIDLIKSVQTKCHYAGAPQVVDAKLDWCHQWKFNDT